MQLLNQLLDEEWLEAAAELEQELGTAIIGRSRRQRLVVSRDFVTERLEVNGRVLSWRQPEGGFTQPNGDINQKTIAWLLKETARIDSDLLELYCGVGNFTLPLSQQFRNVLATELSKPATEAARWNAEHHEANNIELARLSAEEMTAAMEKVRPFRRLAHLKQPLENYQFDTLMVDPPRAGLDEATLQLAAGFERILYISCNTETLQLNLGTLNRTHSIQSLAFFDQFPYTPHLESGVVLTRQKI